MPDNGPNAAARALGGDICVLVWVCALLQEFGTGGPALDSAIQGSSRNNYLIVWNTVGPFHLRSLLDEIGTGVC